MPSLKTTKLKKLPGWTYHAGPGIIRMIAPSFVIADRYLAKFQPPIKTSEPLKIVLSVRGSDAEVNLPTEARPLSSNIDISDYKAIAEVPDKELILAVEDSPKSAAITRIKNSKMLIASSHIESTNGKPYDEIIGESLNPLWHPDELDRLMNHLRLDGQVQNYEYWCWKYHRDEQGEWIRRKQNLAADLFQLVNFRGVECRLSLGVSNQ